MDQRVFEDGDLVVFVDAKGRRRTARLRPGGRSVLPAKDVVDHDAVLGQPEGLVVPSSAGRPVVALRPTLEEYILRMPRRTQVIYPKDLGFVLTRANVAPGARVLEAGVGSGALTLALLRAVGPSGELVSVERRPEFAELARANVRRFFGDLPPNWRLVNADVYEDFPADGLDAVILDLPEPERCVAFAARAVRLGGTLAAWLPTTNQTQNLVLALQAHPAWGTIEVAELLLRPWHVTAESVRPAHRMVAHTGFLISARRIYVPED